MTRKGIFLSVVCLVVFACAEEKRLGRVGDFCSDDKDCEQGLCFESKCLDPDGDEDGDGLKNGVEKFKLGTNPLSADSDGDGLNDYEEVGDINHPQDDDGDGIINALESTQLDEDKDCLPDQVDPNNNTPDEGKQKEIAIVHCQKNGGVCKDRVDEIMASCEDGKPVCDYSGVQGFEEQETLCDGLDNDCDGKTDEDLGGTPCEITNEYGSCPGVSKCENGKESCVGKAPEAERCDGEDNDCDGMTDETFDLLGTECSVGVGACEAQGRYVCSEDGQGVVCDAKPKEPSQETCDGQDNDCDQETDEEGAYGCKEYFYDEDGDGYGKNGVQSKCLCAPTGMFRAEKAGDCNDEDAGINPDATEVCDGIDNNCDGTTDEGVLRIFYKDGDGDGYGGAEVVEACEALQGFVTITGDCDDNDPKINPSASEKCDGIDNNCDGRIDELWEQKGTACDGNDSDFCAEGIWVCTADGSGVECNDTTDDSVEICNGIDDDCDGFLDEEDAEGCTTYYFDNDGDGFALDKAESRCLCSATGLYTADKTGDCDDTDPHINPVKTEVCGNQKDDDCDGETDENQENAVGCTVFYYDGDKDGYGTSAFHKCLCQLDTEFTATNGDDCDDNDPNIHPLATEVCNHNDDDCNGVIDDEGAQGCIPYFFDGDGDRYAKDGAESRCLCGPSGMFTATEVGDCDDHNSFVNPDAQEVCNLKDDDCDGETDEEGAQGCKTFYVDSDLDTYGTSVSKCLCAASGEYTASIDGDCDDSDSKINPSVSESCDGIDNNCDGKTDDENALGCKEYYPDMDGDGYGVATDSKCLCSAQGQYRAVESGDCNDNDAEINPGATEKCDGKDNDCDDVTDPQGSAGCMNYYYDSDDDGYGTRDFLCLCRAEDHYRATNDKDCNDYNSLINPDATETCDRVDNNCDGNVDEEGALGCREYWLDADGDGYGTDDAKCLCAPDGQYSAQCSGDCDDSDSSVHPSGACGLGGSLCGKDADCDGSLLDLCEECDDGNDDPSDGCDKCRFAEFLVNTWTTGSQDHPIATSLGEAGFVVVWEGEDEDGQGYGIFGQRFDVSGKKVGSEFQVNTWTTENQMLPSVATLAGGGFVVVWQSGNWFSSGQDGSDFGIYGQMFNAKGDMVGPEFQVNAWTTGSQENPSVSGLLGGDFVVVWQSDNQDGSGLGVFGQRFSGDGNKVGGEFQVNTWTTNAQWDPSVASLPQGGFVVVWQSDFQDGSNSGIFGQIFDADGNKVGSEFQVNTWTSNYQEDPSVISLSDGFVVVWQSEEQDGSGTGVYGQIFDSNGNKVGSEFLANTTTFGHQGNPSLTSLVNGGFVVVWASHQQDGSDFGVFGQRFDIYGNKVGPEFQVNTWTENEQWGKGIASLVDGGFVVAWHSLEQDGSGYGVYAQVFQMKEVCNGVDDDCDGLTDEEAQGCVVYYLDRDGDGFGDITTGECMCLSPGSGYATRGGDCDDFDPDVNAGAMEICDDKDNDCDGEVDEGCDDDLDGYCDALIGVSGTPSVCPKGGGDCDDNDSKVYPGALPVCGKDGDCDGSLLDALEECDDGTPGYGIWDGCAQCKFVDFQANTYANGYQGMPAVARLSNGNFVVAWEGAGAGDDFGVYGRIFTPNLEKVSGEFIVNTTTTSMQNDPDIMPFADGFIMTWTGTDSQTSYRHIYGQRFDLSGNKVGNEFQIDQCDGSEGSHGTSLSSGGFVVLWQCDDGSSWGVFGQRLDNSGQKVGQQFIANTYTSDDQSQVYVASLPSGKFVVVWNSLGQDGYSYGVFAQMFADDGTKVGSEFQVNTNTAGTEWFPSAASLENGGFVVVWRLGYASIGGIFAQIFDKDGNKVGSEFRVNGYTVVDNNLLEHPSITGLPGGNFVVSWSTRYADSGQSYAVMGQVFDASGHRVGTEFVANTYSTDDQMLPVTAPLSSGKFVVLWDSYKQDGSDFGVFGRIFSY